MILTLVWLGGWAHAGNRAFIATTDGHRLFASVTAVVPVMHAPHVTASPVKR
jgi:hypothetical protein